MAIEKSLPRAWLRTLLLSQDRQAQTWPRWVNMVPTLAS